MIFRSCDVKRLCTGSAALRRQAALAALAALAVLLLCGLAWVLRSSCQVAQRLDEPSGTGFWGMLEWIQWTSLQQKPAAPEVRRATKLLLVALRDLFEEHGVVYWLECGTLLGAARSGQMVAYDHDGDMGIMQEGLLRLLEADSRNPLRLPEGVHLQILYSKHHSHLWEGHPSWMSSKRNMAIPARAYHKATNSYVDVMLFNMSRITKRDLKSFGGDFANHEFSSKPYIVQSVVYSSRDAYCYGCHVLPLPDVSLENVTHNARVFWAAYHKGFSMVRVPAQWILPANSCTFEGETFSCPQQARSYLQYRYGPGSLQYGDPSKVCTQLADVTFWLSSLARGRLPDRKREDGSRWFTFPLAWRHFNEERQLLPGHYRGEYQSGMQEPLRQLVRKQAQLTPDAVAVFKNGKGLMKHMQNL